MFGDAMSIFARRTCAPSANSPARIRANRSQVLLDRPIAVRAGPARLGQRAAVGAHLVGGQAVDVRQAALDQVDRVSVERLEVVRGVERLAAPNESQPPDVFLNGLDVLDVFLGRVGVVESQIAGAAELGRDAKIQADRLGMTDVQIAVRLRGKPRGHTSAMLPRLHVVRNDGADEVERRLRVSHRASHSRVGTHRETFIIRAEP